MNDELTLKEEKFCQLYATDKEFFGNGVETYLEVYDVDRSKSGWYNTACSSASQMLTKPNICNRINELLTAGGLNDQHVDKQLLFLITQYADFNGKVQAIREYNKLKKRITDKLEFQGETTNVNLEGTLTEDNQQVINEVIAKRKQKL